VANKAINENLKKAPEGSEAAVNAVKAAVNAGNKALAEARKNAKKTAELAQEGFASHCKPFFHGQSSCEYIATQAPSHK